ncbi:PepSY domain-containing protein [Streptomyces sp. NPDC047017]|uniref:PepSY domain-containing protein n=1 Tax=Streptomyces sp. NPDC047017 TaxID=3155024 RepID=UPI0033EEAFCA
MTTARRLPPPRSLAAICALGGSALLLTACSGTGTTGSSAEAAEASPTSSMSAPMSSPSPSGSLTQDQTERRDLIPKAHVTWDKAADTAVKEVSGGKLVGIELKSVSHDTMNSSGSPSPSMPNPAPSQGAAEWVAKVAAADGTVHRVDVDAANGKVFRSQAEPGQDSGDKSKIADRLKKAAKTPAQAAKTATDKTKGTVTAVSLDENNSHKLVWSVDVVDTKNWNKTTYDVDAANGNVLRQHVDRD